MASIDHNVSTIPVPWAMVAVVMPVGGTLQEIVLPIWARTVTIYAEGAIITLERTGTDGGAVGTHKQPIAIDSVWAFQPRGMARPSAAQKMYLAGAGGTARITYEAAGHA